MKLSIFIIFATYFLPPLRGLDLTLDPDPPSVLGAKRACAVLICKESVGMDSSTPDKTQPLSTVSFSSMASMAVFQSVSDTHNGRRDVLVASVNTQHPRVVRVVNGIRVDGQLGTDHSTLRVELVKQDDCHADYTCQVQGLDRQGREAVNTASLLQQLNRTGNEPNNANAFPAVSLQLLSSVLDKFQLIEQRLEDKIESMEHRLADRSESFERNVQNRLSLLENRIEDKIDKNSNLNKITQPDPRVLTELGRLRSEAKEDILSSVESLKRELRTSQEQSLGRASETFEGFLNNTSTLLSSMERDIDLARSCGQTGFENATKTLKVFMETENDIIRRMLNDVSVSNNELAINFKELESNIRNSTTRSLAKTVNPEKDCAIAQDVMSSSTEMFVAKNCQKDLHYKPGPKMPPYAIIYPDPTDNTVLDFPHLCDTVTHGGGWVLIQRHL